MGKYVFVSYSACSSLQPPLQNCVIYNFQLTFSVVNDLFSDSPLQTVNGGLPIYQQYKKPKSTLTTIETDIDLTTDTDIVE